MSAGTRILTAPTGERYRFDPGSFCLELLLTGGPQPWDRYEILHSPADLAGWLVDSRLAGDIPLRVDDLRIRPVELRRITAFRDALWRVVPAMVRGDRPAPDDIALVNDSAGAPPRPRLDPATHTRQWVTPVTGDQVLAAAAREAIDLFGTDRFVRVRQCEGTNCYLLFLDTSRPGNRRWCSMQRCGNRHKVSSYRARHA